jgi:hypothetical protein
LINIFLQDLSYQK